MRKKKNKIETTMFSCCNATKKWYVFVCINENNSNNNKWERSRHSLLEAKVI